MPARKLANVKRLDALLRLVLDHAKQLLLLHPLDPGLLFLPLHGRVLVEVILSNHRLNVLQIMLLGLLLLPQPLLLGSIKLGALALTQIDRLLAEMRYIVHQFHLVVSAGALVLARVLNTASPSHSFLHLVW